MFGNIFGIIELTPSMSYSSRQTVMVENITKYTMYFEEPGMLTDVGLVAIHLASQHPINVHAVPERPVWLGCQREHVPCTVLQLGYWRLICEIACEISNLHQRKLFSEPSTALLYSWAPIAPANPVCSGSANVTSDLQIGRSVRHGIGSITTKQGSYLGSHLAIRVKKCDGRQPLIEVCGVLDNGSHNAISWVAKLWKVQLDLQR